MSKHALPAVLSLFLLACSATQPMVSPSVPDGGIDAGEVCDGVDNDLDGRVDEDFKNDAGVYVHDAHCGHCGSACVPDQVTTSARCELTDAGPACRAASCIDGYTPSGSSTCVPRDGWLCQSCLDDRACGGFDGGLCTEIGGEPRCTVRCETGACPDGYVCAGGETCMPASGSCRCVAGAHFTLTCTIMVNNAPCVGTSICDNGTLSPCAGREEFCDGLDNDCDGVTDQPFIDGRGVYRVDLHHCGACGVDCTLNNLYDFEITCGGPETSPACAILCEDAVDGIQMGDMVDADLKAETGCECAVRSTGDETGADFGDDTLDANCDGADGVVALSYYVIPTGDDTAPGSPNKPLSTVQAAVDAAFASLSTNYPRPNVFVAAGAYREVLFMRDGVRLFGGYRPDFLARDPAAYVTEISATAWATAPGGAALVASGVGILGETVIDGIAFIGASAPQEARYAYGAYLSDLGEGLRLQSVTVIAGDGADGENGTDGESGISPIAPGESGEPQKVAVEDEYGTCITDENHTQGGAGALAVCEGIWEVSGGNGGGAGCATSIYDAQESGTQGKGYEGAEGGLGGSGGWNVAGPIDQGDIVYCGLADFTVSSGHEIAEDGMAGENGEGGNGGAGCIDTLGTITRETWEAEMPEDGSSGLPGAGGGGGGAGGSALYNDALCPYQDGIGAGGGGGGAGGCGGQGGNPATSGGPSVGMVILAGNTGATPTLVDVTIQTGVPGDGGFGGHGGDGGAGGLGGPGGELSATERLSPSLAGPDHGGHGGAGGAGGRGGGAGGGCGGANVGIWIVPEQSAVSALNAIADNYKETSHFLLDAAGMGGMGGFGGSSGNAGNDGEVRDVIVE